MLGYVGDWIEETNKWITLSSETDVVEDNRLASRFHFGSGMIYTIVSGDLNIVCTKLEKQSYIIQQFFSHILLPYCDFVFLLDSNKSDIVSGRRSAVHAEVIVNNRLASQQSSRWYHSEVYAVGAVEPQW